MVTMIQMTVSAVSARGKSGSSDLLDAFGSKDLKGSKRIQTGIQKHPEDPTRSRGSKGSEDPLFPLGSEGPNN